MSAEAAVEQTLREVIEELAAFERRAGSDGERDAAVWLGDRLKRCGCTDVAVQEEEFLDGYADSLSKLCAASAVAGLAGLASPRCRPLAGLVALASAAAVADDVSNGPRLFRRAATEPASTWNVTASCGDQSAARTLVVLAHHDAGRGGRVFDDAAQTWFGERFPGLLERRDTSLPLWWLVLSGPLAVAYGAAARRRDVMAVGLAGSAVATAAFRDIASQPIVPGANDNLSGVAALVALAELLADRQVDGLRVLLVSCGAEEVLQGGIHGFGRRWFGSLDRDRTWFLNLETVGSPRLVMLEGEGPVVMEDYHDRSFRDLVARSAEHAGAPLRRGMRSRVSTDSVIPSRAGYPTATLTSIDRHKSLSNYHKMTDTPDNVDYRTVRQALAVVEAVIGELARNPWIGKD